MGALLAGLGGALQIPREPASLGVDLAVISDAFVVVVVGGLGSIPGAFIAALLIAQVKAFCIGLGYSKATLVVEFIVMAAVLVLRPWGLLGQAQAAARNPGLQEASLEAPGKKFLAGGAVLLAALALIPPVSSGYTLVLLTDILVFALFAASLHFILGPAGLYSFGHAAYFGLGAYAAGIFLLQAKLPMELALALAPLAAGLGALLFGWFCVRLSGVYSAMLTLAFAQIAWSAAFQWDALTGGSNGIIGIWPAPWLASTTGVLLLTLALCAAGSRFCGRRSTPRSAMRCAPAAIRRCARRPSASTCARCNGRRSPSPGLAAGIAGALYAFSKGSISPDAMGIQRSVDGLVMVMLGGIQTLSGPVWGAALFTWLAGCSRAQHRLLARRDRRRHSCAGPGAAEWHRLSFPAAKMSILAVRELSKSFGGVRAVDRVSFSVAAGEMLAMIGPNGAGKSTCFNMVNGQLPPDSGSIELEGKNLAGKAPREICRLGVGRTFQIAATFGSMTVRENVQVALLSHARMLGSLFSAMEKKFENETNALLKSVGMGPQAEKQCAELAYGDLKRVELAIALASQPRLLLMDEPTAGMASAERHLLMNLVETTSRGKASRCFSPSTTWMSCSDMPTGSSCSRRAS